VSWRVAIRHRTAYRYAGDVRSSYNEARVTPLTTHRQLVVEADVRVTPATPTFRYWDYWGTMVDAFDVHEPHTELAVTGTSVVETSPPHPPADITWVDVASAEVCDQLAELLAPTGYVSEIEEVTEAALSMARTGSPANACEQAAEWVRDRLRHEKGTTDVSTTAAEALRIGTGVCQDYAHLALALVRAMGIPARYVSGYIFPSHEADVGMDVAGQSHAWVEAWTGDWYALDPTHGIPVGERHVVVARGRDYDDVAPLRGIYHGGPAQGLEVTVDLTRLG
jgi:transglutaminase-like putative cysteine protease